MRLHDQFSVLFLLDPLKEYKPIKPNGTLLLKPFLVLISGAGCISLPRATTAAASSNDPQNLITVGHIGQPHLHPNVVLPLVGLGPDQEKDKVPQSYTCTGRCHFMATPMQYSLAYSKLPKLWHGDPTPVESQGLLQPSQREGCVHASCYHCPK